MCTPIVDSLSPTLPCQGKAGSASLVAGLLNPYLSFIILGDGTPMKSKSNQRTCVQTCLGMLATTIRSHTTLTVVCYFCTAFEIDATHRTPFQSCCELKQGSSLSVPPGNSKDGVSSLITTGFDYDSFGLHK